MAASAKFAVETTETDERWYYYDLLQDYLHGHVASLDTDLCGTDLYRSHSDPPRSRTATPLATRPCSTVPRRVRFAADDGGVQVPVMQQEEEEEEPALFIAIAEVRSFSTILYIIHD